ncbi:MAG TPA: AsmA-like C-terminal region-containing protein, partial [Stellaceae bacterium]
QGVVQADADDLRSVLAWLGVPADAVPADRLHKSSLSGRFTVTGDRLDLAGIEATLDATRLKGAATVILRERPGIGLRLVADRFNLDAYLPGAAAAAGPTGDAAPPHAASGALVGSFDTNLDAHVEALTWHGQPLGDVHLAGTLQNGDATIRELSIGDLGGAAVRLSGAIQALAGGTPKGQLAFDLSGPEFDRVLRVLWPGLATGRSYGDFRLGGGVSLDGEKLSVTGDLEMLQGRLHVTGDLSAGGASALDVAIEHPSFAGLVRNFSPGYRPAGGDPGAFRLAGRVTGAPPHFSVDRLTLAIGESTLDGKVDVALGGVRPLLTADVKIGDWAIDRLLGSRQTAMLGAAGRHAALLPGVLLAQARAASPANSWSHEPIDLAVLTLADIDLGLTGRSLADGGWRVDQPALTATVKDGALAVKRLTGSVLGGSIDASGSVDGAAMPAFRSRLMLRDADLKQALADAAGVAIVDGRFDVDASIAGEGRSPADMVSHLAGDATLHAHDGAVSGIDLAAVNARLSAPDRPADLLGLIRSGAGGRTAFSALQGSFHLADGVARSDDIRLVADGGEGKASASFNLPQWTLASRIELRPIGVQDAPPLVLRLEGPIDQPNEVFEINALEQFLEKRQQR